MHGDPQARLFIALWPDAQVRHALREWRDAWQWPRGSSPVKPERLHMTLHFLGSVSVGRILELREALSRVRSEAFELEFGVQKLWPHGIAVMEPLSAPEQLLRLHQDTGAALESLRMPVEERVYKPHVTLARRAVKAEVPEPGPALKWAVDGFALMESAASGYTVVEQFR
ncbi:RNA 2',3'-cyclic phosphodiesterase [Massilia cavernae]|uniref:RNA 2',3'-cyclic phosphodiesterase n=1 Tax=Massilia cavernae TaxID=2320864 RepID=A0A418XRQ0_9BURK|nr:RNA 2',3'-cyclic phosphodiesterase [Massilia cavernae]RJG15219.1 RNA 2',3'-cyclic phosphodiesterase [Massilia cavernae]